MSSSTIVSEVEFGGRDRLRRRVIANVSLGLLTEAIHPDDLNLTSIESIALGPSQPSAGTVSLTRGTWLTPFLQRPGSYLGGGNHASVQAYGFGLSANGTPIYAQLTGSITVRVDAQGW